MQNLRKSLEAEREAVFIFIFTTLDETLTPAQEAFLDIESYPFCPDIWEMANLLAQRRRVRIPSDYAVVNMRSRKAPEGPVT